MGTTWPHLPLDTEWKSHLQTHQNEPTFSITKIPTSFFDVIGLYPCLACNNPTNVYVLQSNLDSHNKHIHAATRSHTNSKFLADIFPDSNWSSTLTWLQTLDIHPPPFWHNIYPHLLGNDRAMTHETTKKLCQALIHASIPPTDQLANSPMDKTSPDPLWKPIILTFLPPLGTQLLYILTMPILPPPMLPCW